MQIEALQRPPRRHGSRDAVPDDEGCARFFLGAVAAYMQGGDSGTCSTWAHGLTARSGRNSSCIAHGGETIATYEAPSS